MNISKIKKVVLWFKELDRPLKGLFILFIIIPVLFLIFSIFHPFELFPHIKGEIYKLKNRPDFNSNIHNRIFQKTIYIRRLTFPVKSGLTYSNGYVYGYSDNMYIVFVTHIHVKKNININFHGIVDDKAMLYMDSRKQLIVGNINFYLTEGTHRMKIILINSTGYIGIKLYYTINGRTYPVGVNSKYISFGLR